MAQQKPRTTDRIGDRLIPLFTLGELYMSDFIGANESPKLPKLEMKMMLAPKSGLVQLETTPDFDSMYRQYWYASGTNETMTLELKDIAEKIQKLIKPTAGDIHVDIGCNDGTLLSFINRDMVRIGFDPAKNGYKEQSIKHANCIIEDYFSYENFVRAGYEGKKAKTLTSIAMFYDLEDPHAFVQDVKKVLDKQGLWIIQMSYTPLMLQQLAFDNICHEHLEYYSLHSLKYLLDQNDFEIVDCELNDVNGGSFRIYIRNKDADPTLFATAPYRDVAKFRVESIMAEERRLKVNEPEIYMEFFRKVSELKQQTMDFIRTEKAKGKKIWGYGASTKGNTLLQWFGLDNTLIDAIAERQPRKFGLKTAGSNIPIKSEEEMRAAKPDYVLVLPWHFIAEFVRREQKFLEEGGAFIVPCPKFEIIRKK
jgi:hypothetical protein